MSDSSPPRLALQALGGLRLTLDGQPVADLVTRKAEALLIYLACQAHPQPREVLADLLWDDASQTQAAGNLRVLLNSLRRRLAPFLCIERYSLGFNFDSHFSFDVADFEEHVRARQLDRAIDLYRGDFLAGFNVNDSRRFEEWALLERERLQRLAVDTLDELIDTDVRARRYRAGIDHATRLLRIDPLREDAHRQLMLLYARDGQRHAALRQYQTCRSVLHDELDVDPMPETTALAERIKAADAARRTELPIALTPFIGRQAEFAQIADRLADPHCRLLTLVGAGGSGKTRLAIEAARTLEQDYLNGVYFAPLAAIAAPDRLFDAIADAIGLALKPQAEARTQLIAWLRDKETLLILDNFDHLIAATDEVIALLKAAPDLKLLITSRTRLNLQAEWLIEVTGLAHAEAVKLFVQNATRSLPDFVADAGVARICDLVQGVPLAIELAAAWVRDESCTVIADQIERSLDFLATAQRDVPERHRSLRAVFDQSWQLLNATERDGFSRLAVFRGGFDHAAAQRVAAADGKLLAALANKSLIRRVAADRYDLHEMTRQYALEKLAEQLELAEATRLQYTQHFADWLHQLAPQFRSAQRRAAVSSVAVDWENVGQAWQWAATHDRAAEIDRMLDSVYQFCVARGRFQEGGDLFAPVINQVRDQPLVVARVRARYGALLQHRSQYDAARVELENGLAMFDRFNAVDDQIFAHLKLTDLLRRQGEGAPAIQHGEQAAALARTCGDDRGLAEALHELGTIHYRQGAVSEARAMFEESRTAAQRSGDPSVLTLALNMLGDIACHAGDYVTGQQIFEECLRISRELDEPYRVAVHLNNLGTALHTQGRLTEARAYYQESLDLCRQMGDEEGQVDCLEQPGRGRAVVGRARRGQAGLSGRVDDRAPHSRSMGGGYVRQQSGRIVVIAARLRGGAAAYAGGGADRARSAGVVAADEGDLESGALLSSDRSTGARRVRAGFRRRTVRHRAGHARARGAVVGDTGAFDRCRGHADA